MCYCPGIFETMDDVRPVEDPDEDEAKADVRRHLFLQNKVQRQKNRLTNKLAMYRSDKPQVRAYSRLLTCADRSEKQIVEEQAKYMSSWEQWKLHQKFVRVREGDRTLTCISQKFKRWSNAVRDGIASYRPWRSSIKAIEGRLGSAIVSS